MSFINPTEQGRVYAPGYFLAHEGCVRETKQILQEGSSTADNGGKYVPMGTLYSVTTGEGGEAVTDYIGFVYEDVDVTSGDMPGSVVTKGVVIEDRLPDELDTDVKSALEAKGFTFVAETEVIRPDWTNDSDDESE